MGKDVLPPGVTPTRGQRNRTSQRRRAPRTGRWALAATVVALLATLTGAPAGATGDGGHGGGGSGSDVKVLAEGLLSPLHLDVQGHGRWRDVLVSQSFAGTIGRVENGGVTEVVSEPGGGTGGMQAGPYGTLAYLAGGESGSFLKALLPGGQIKTIADLSAYEAANNPDQIYTYGLQGATPECLESLPPDIPLAPYTGMVDSNPYELLVTHRGAYVADAGGNTILFVTWSGKVRTVSVLPPRPEVITAEVAGGLGLPECVVGLTYNFEAVPTDVENGPGPYLYVSSLPGGPEDASLGARGGVFKVNPHDGSNKLIGTGFLGASNLAVDPWGSIYVTELFGNRISKLINGAPVPLRELNQPAALEWAGGRLYATTDALPSEDGPPAGKVVAFKPW